MRTLEGRTALVTGAARRIGRAIALGVARAGCDVVVHHRVPDSESARQAGELVDRLRAMGRRGWQLAADLSDPEQSAGLMARAVDLAGPIDILVNSASSFGLSSLLDFSPRALQQEVQVNAMAPLQLARDLAGQGREGEILNILDTRITDYDSEHAAYHLSKRMLHSITRMLALELAPRIRVNAVAPGAVLPPEGKGLDHLAARAREVPLQRHGDLEGLVDAALFLLRSEFITGQVLFYDGGYHMKGAFHV